MTGDLKRKLVAALVILALPLAATCLYLLLRDRLPAEIYGIYDWGSNAEKVEVSAFSNVPSCLFAMSAVVVLFVADGRGSRQAALLLWFISAIGSCYYIKSLLMGWLLPDVAPELWQSLVVMIPVVGGATILRRLLLPPLEASPPALPDSPFRFQPDVRVAWAGSAFGPRRLGWAALTVCVGGGLALWLPEFGIPIILLGAVGLRSLGSRVLVSDQGVRVTAWPVTRPRHDLALRQIAAAHVAETARSEMGERKLVGLRDDLADWTLLLRDGVHLVLNLDNGRYVAVSVDDPQEAADVINALIARERARTTLASDARHP